MVRPVKTTASRQIPVRSNIISFLLGVSITYLCMKPLTECPSSSLSATSAATSAATSTQSASQGDATSTTTSKSILLPTDTQQQEKNFFDIASKTGTDKVAGVSALPGCLANDASCTRPSCVREECRPWGHFYHTLYQQRLGKYSLDSAEPFQFLEIGFYVGKGYETYKEFLSPKAEVHSIEISCMPEGKEKQEKWPYRNDAQQNPNYQTYIDEDRLHCGDGSDLNHLDKFWKESMNRPGAPPLKVVVDDGAHHASHMAQSLFFWFPRIEPGGLLIVEDIQPIFAANLFRTQFLPQIMSDLHFCGDPKEPKDEPCFPLLQNLLHSIHCEMHICVFERNQKPAIPDLPLSNSTMPAHTLNAIGCPSIKDGWGLGLKR